MDATNNSNIHVSESVKIFAQGKDVFIETLKADVSPEELHKILSDHPEIQVTSFIALKSSLHSVNQPMKIGMLKERILIRLAENDMKAYLTLNIPKNILDSMDRNALMSEINAALAEKKVICGIKTDFLPEEIHPGQEILVAEGIPPVNGKDAEIKQYQMRETKPEISEDGKANFYDLKLINKVEANEWLGEKIEPTEGTPGQSVTGTPIKPIPGRNANFQYDKNSVYEVKEDNKTTYLSIFAGAVKIIDGKITVMSHIDIMGDVDLSTGNLNFDGSITIKGTIQEGFSVQATGDIEVLSDFGVSGVKEIISTEGSIYIKGGVAGQNKTQIKAARDIFTKFADYATIECDGSLHFGYYCMNSNVKACEIIMDSSSGQMFGGNIIAETKVICPIIGSEAEKRTVITILGFDRAGFEAQLKETDEMLAKARILQKQAAEQLKQASQPNGDKKLAAELTDTIRKTRLQIKECESRKKSIISYLKTKGEGEVTASKVIYPNCLLQIKNIIFEVRSLTKATSYYVVNRELITS